MCWVKMVFCKNNIDSMILGKIKKTHWFENIVKLDIFVVTSWRYLIFFEIFHNSYVIAIFLHISILMLQVDITILLVNILILHVDIFDRNISCTQKQRYVTIQKIIQYLVFFTWPYKHFIEQCSDFK